MKPVVLCGMLGFLGILSAAFSAAASQGKEELKPVNPVHHSKLIPLLPKEPKGFKGEEAQGQTVEVANFKISQAERSYEDGDKQIRVQIIDGAHNAAYYAGFYALQKFSFESNDGYVKGVKYGDNPGFEKFDKEGMQTEIGIIVTKRFLVFVRGNGIPAETVREVMKGIDLKKLGGLK